eukprot:3172922-Pyramimonas_sp.AAC.1
MPRKVVNKDWRYGHYEGPLLNDNFGNTVERAWRAAEPKLQQGVAMIKGYLADRKANDLQEPWTQEPAGAEL